MLQDPARAGAKCEEAHMNLGAVNWLAVIVCVVLSMAIGSIWYHPKVFFTTWWKGIGKTEPVMGATNPGPMLWVLTILASFVEAVSVALVLNTMGAAGAAAGAAAGFMLWLGFIAPTNLVNKLFAGHGLKVWAIEAGNHLVNMLAFGAILGAWR
jgi:hypothetical protein